MLLLPALEKPRVCDNGERSWLTRHVSQRRMELTPDYVPPLCTNRATVWEASLYLDRGQMRVSGDSLCTADSQHSCQILIKLGNGEWARFRRKTVITNLFIEYLEKIKEHMTVFGVKMVISSLIFSKLFDKKVLILVWLIGAMVVEVQLELWEQSHVSLFFFFKCSISCWIVRRKDIMVSRTRDEQWVLGCICTDTRKWTQVADRCNQGRRQ